MVPEVAFWGFWGLICIENWSQNFDSGLQNASFGTKSRNFQNMISRQVETNLYPKPKKWATRSWIPGVAYDPKCLKIEFCQNYNFLAIKCIKILHCE